MNVDYEFRDRIEVEDQHDLEQLFHDHTDGHLRILGTGSSQHRLPSPPAQTTLISLAKLDDIERLEGPDLTCSVQPGVTREQLDEELDRRNLTLPCMGSGTLGGLFAADPLGSLSPGAHSPRSLLLGLEGILPEGLTFKTGSRVVKSVAGFDLHKLFVGSRGNLFAATLLHLKLRPKPPASVRFKSEPLDRTAAVQLFSTLHRRADPPAAFVLHGQDNSYSIHGLFQGAATQVSENLKHLELHEHDGDLPLRVHPDGETETLRGRIRHSQLADLLHMVPEIAPVIVTGGGWFEAAFFPRAIEGALEKLAKLPAPAEITEAGPARRGRGTPIEANAASLMQNLKMALDPKGVLA